MTHKACACAGVVIILWAWNPLAAAEEEAWTAIFNGQDLKGWHVSSKTGHGTGGQWEVRDGAITGTQDKPGNGGILITDAAYGDVEVSLEMNNDYGPDSGLFLRSTEDGKAYQALIDYHGGQGNLMGVYGEGIGGWVARNYILFGDSPEEIRIVDYPPFPCPFTPQQWKTLWKHGQWNEMRARITGNPPAMQTWIKDVKIMEWKDDRKRLPDKGGIALQVHGGGNLVGKYVRYRAVKVRRLDVPDNTLTIAEKAAGWKLLFDGKTLSGWKTDRLQESKVPVDDGAIQTHGCGGYMMIYEKPMTDFMLALDFRLSKGCNSGIFLRTFSLEPKPGWDVGFNGIEVQLLDSKGTGLHDTGAIYDLQKPTRNAMKPAGEWNHVLIRCEKNVIDVTLNGERVNHLDLDQFKEPGKRPDGSAHKFAGIAYKDFPRTGYIGLQDHGSPVWFKNIKLRPLGDAK
ncbi:MAG: hypothetical protein AMXMBFR83_02390 [Phycisphaerae bacterium]